MKKCNRKGFTITELVIVIAVIAILAAVLIPTFSNVIKKANDSAVLQEAKNLHTSYIGAIDYAAGDTAADTALIKVVKGNDTYYVKVIDGSVSSDIFETQPTMAGGTPLIEASETALDGVTWTIIECATSDHVNVGGTCSICGKVMA